MISGLAFRLAFDFLSSSFYMSNDALKFAKEYFNRFQQGRETEVLKREKEARTQLEQQTRELQRQIEVEQQERQRQHHQHRQQQQQQFVQPPQQQAQPLSEQGVFPKLTKSEGDFSGEDDSDIAKELNARSAPRTSSVTEVPHSSVPSPIMKPFPSETKPVPFFDSRSPREAPSLPEGQSDGKDVKFAPLPAIATFSSREFDHPSRRRDPSSVKIQAIQRQLDDTKNAMLQSIDKVLERGEKLEDLVAFSDDLYQEPLTFKPTAASLRKV